LVKQELPFEQLGQRQAQVSNRYSDSDAESTNAATSPLYGDDLGPLG
jgi:hypothetical protein